MLTRSRSNGITGGNIRLNAYFYKDNELESPSSIKEIQIKNWSGSVIATYPGSNLSSLGNGIKSLNFTVPISGWESGSYFDNWNYVAESGMASTIQSNQFKVSEAQWEQRISLTTGNYSLKGTLETEKVSL